MLEDPRDRKPSWIVGLAATLAAMAIAGGIKLYADIQVLTDDVNELIFDEEDDDRQDAAIKKFWRINNWSKDRINELRQQHDLPLVSWPDLGD